MLEKLKKKVYEANILLSKSNLVISTWGNVSGIDRENGLIVIKPSGIQYNNMKLEDMVVLNLKGEIIEGKNKPSSDTETHLEIYRNFEEIDGIVHTHSKWATVFAQAGQEIEVYGTTQADYAYGAIPCTRDMKKEEIEVEYEKNTGKVIVEKLKDKNIAEIPGILVKNHGPFVWGKSAEKAVENAIILEEIAMMAFHTKLLDKNVKKISENLLRKHFFRKNGSKSYYGQNK